MRETSNSLDEFLKPINQRPRSHYAGGGVRFAAFLLDCVVVVPTLLLVSWALGVAPWSPQGLDKVGWFGLNPHIAKVLRMFIGVLLYDFYFTALVHRFGRTWGMAGFGLTVVNEAGGFVTKRAARRRYAASILSALAFGVGFLSIVWDKQRQGWHDKMTKTWVMIPGVLMPQMVEQATKHTRQEDESEEDRKTFDNFTVFFQALVFLPGMILMWPLRVIAGRWVQWLRHRANTRSA